MPTSTNSCLPQRGNRFTRTFGKFMLNRLGWSFDNHLPNIPKQVVIVAPHTSNWDFVIGVLVVFALDIEAHWIGKHTIFAPPFKRIMEWLGGIPVNRKLPNDLVISTTKRFDEEEKFILGIAPEGTRGRVEKWKQGFYRIAIGANVPVVCAYLDYRTRSIGFGQPVKVSGDFAEAIVMIREFYANVTARFPEKFQLPGEE